MSEQTKNKSSNRAAKEDLSAREAITYYNPMEEREADKAPLQMKLIRRIFHYTKPYAAKRNWLFVLTFMRGLQLPALAWLIGRTITGPIAHRDLAGIFWYAAGYLALALFTVVSFHFRQRFALELGEAVVHDMRSDLFRKLMTMPMSFFNQTKFGRIISRMTSDIDSVRAGAQDVAFVLVVQGLQMTTSAALMAYYDWKLFSLMVILAPVIWVVNQNYRREMSRRLRHVQESWSRVASTLAESVSGIRVTQAFVRHEVNAGFFRKLIDVHGENNVGVAQASAVFVPLLQLKSQLFLGAMALLGGYGALRWHGWLHMEVGDLVMFFFLANLFFDPVQAIGNQLNQAFMAMAGAERLFRMLDQKPEWVDAPDGQAVAGDQRPRGIPGGELRVSAGTAGAQGHFICGRAGAERRPGGAHRQRQDDAGGTAAKILPADGRARAGGRHGLEHSHRRFVAVADGQRAAEQFSVLRHRAGQHPARAAGGDGSRGAGDAGGTGLRRFAGRAAARTCIRRWPSAAHRCHSASGNWCVSRAPCWSTRASWCWTRRPARLTRSPRRGCNGRWKSCCAGGRHSSWRTG